MTSPLGFMNFIRGPMSITIHISLMAQEYHLWWSTIKLGYVSVRFFWASWHAEFQPADSVYCEQGTVSEAHVNILLLNIV